MLDQPQYSSMLVHASAHLPYPKPNGGSIHDRSMVVWSKYVAFTDRGGKRKAAQGSLNKSSGDGTDAVNATTFVAMARARGATANLIIAIR